MEGGEASSQVNSPEEIEITSTQTKTRDLFTVLPNESEMDASSQEVKSPDEIEDGISSTQTVTWDPFTVFPKEIYMKIFDSLDNPADKMNFMNAHEKWYGLFKDKRTLFLFQDVFREMRKAEGEISISCPDAHNFRLVCQDWDKGVQNYFQLHASNFKLDTLESNGRFTMREVFEELKGDGDDRVLGRVTRNSHFAWVNGENLDKDIKMFSVTHPPSRNPFLSRKVCLFMPMQGRLPPLYEEGIKRYVAALDSLLEIYGRHIWHCAIITNLDPPNCRRMVKWLSQMPELKTLVMYGGRGEMDIRGICCMEPLLLLEMDKLKVLKSEGLPPVAFNKLFSNLRGLEKIQIRLDESSLTEFEVAQTETLKEAFFTPKDIKDLFDFVEKCGSFPNLKVLLIKLELMDELKAYLELDDWRMASSILKEKFPALEDLSLRLPTAVPLKETLNLPKLKKLWITLPHWASLDFLLPCKALEELKITLEHLNLAIRKDLFGTQQPRQWADCFVEREETKFNVDLKTLWQYNVWDEFPKLRALHIQICQEIGYKDHFRYEREGKI